MDMCPRRLSNQIYILLPICCICRIGTVSITILPAAMSHCTAITSKKLMLPMKPTIELQRYDIKIAPFRERRNLIILQLMGKKFNFGKYFDKWGHNVLLWNVTGLIISIIFCYKLCLYLTCNHTSGMRWHLSSRDRIIIWLQTIWWQ